MNLVNFRFETDADGIALAHLGHARPLDERHHAAGDGRAGAAHRHSGRRRPTIKGCVITSGKDTFSGGADLSMLQHGAAQYAKALQGEGRRGGEQALLRARAASRCSIASSRPAASLSPSRFTAPALAAPSSWRSPATTGSSPTTTRPGSACRRSRSGCFPAPAARSASRA